MSDDYDKGYREGVLVERRRTILVALQAKTSGGSPSYEGLSLAHRIGEAGEAMPREIPWLSDEWSPFGERRVHRKLPSFMEKKLDIVLDRDDRFTEALERDKRKWTKTALLDLAIQQQECIKELRQRVEDRSSERVQELEALVEQLTRQLTGIID